MEPRVEHRLTLAGCAARALEQLEAPERLLELLAAFADGILAPR